MTKTKAVSAVIIALLIIAASLAFALSSICISRQIPTSGTLDIQNVLSDGFLIGAGAETWSNLPELNSNYQMNMTLGSSWISSHDDLYGWWATYFSPSTLWSQNYVPHLITWQYFKNTWGVDYSAASLSLHKQEWLDDLTFMANHLKGPDDGKPHSVSVVGN